MMEILMIINIGIIVYLILDYFLIVKPKREQVHKSLHIMWNQIGKISEELKNK
jgi:hypothetical protein